VKEERGKSESEREREKREREKDVGPRAHLVPIVKLQRPAHGLLLFDALARARRRADSIYNYSNSTHFTQSGLAAGRQNLFTNT
jgi:hypothetical protein